MYTNAYSVNQHFHQSFIPGKAFTVCYEPGLPVKVVSYVVVHKFHLVTTSLLLLSTTT